MILSKAYSAWAAQPQNTALAAKSRRVFGDVIIGSYGSRDVREFTKDFTAEIFRQSTVARQYKIQSGSVLVHVLKYAAGLGECPRPDFDYTIASASPNSNQAEVDQEHPLPQAKPADVRPVKAKSVKAKKSHGGGRPVRPMVALDINTLAVVAEFPSISEAGRQMSDSPGANKAVYNAHRSRHTAYGYYWCTKGEEASFKPSEFAGTPKKKVEIKKNIDKSPEKAQSRRQTVVGEPVRGGEHQMPETPVSAPTTLSSLSSFSDAELRDELKRRGYEGVLVKRMEV